MTPKVVGLVWDYYTPQVEAQITRDLIALKGLPSGRNLMVCYETEEPAITKVLNSLQVLRSPALPLAKLWIVYQTGPDEVEAPEHAEDVIERDLQVHVADADVLDTGDHTGYYLKPQGRIVAPTISLNRPMPQHQPASTDPMVIYLWGSTKQELPDSVVNKLSASVAARLGRSIS